MTKSIHEEIRERIEMLRRPEWVWVKHSPSSVHMMCAIVDNNVAMVNGRIARITERNGLSNEAVEALNHWMHNNFVDENGKRWGTMVDYNDNPAGAKTVDDVITVLEKFASELQ